MKTIKQVAEELGVTKEAIRKHLDKLPPTTVTTGVNRTTFINPKGEAFLKALVSTKAPTEVPTNNDWLVLELQHKIEKLELEKELRGKGLTEQIAILERELEIRNRQIDDLNNRIAEAHDMAIKAQQLHGADKVIELTDGQKKQGLFDRLFGRKE